MVTRIVEERRQAQAVAVQLAPVLEIAMSLRRRTLLSALACR
jgi:hypothetical protein